ncbi:MAG: right-handed parallel beta-helix repeat-containing protein [Phycisphaerae bacterium]|nr:right-handed parallel beta-helix repeat-containing protein [Phycisphaerae bacterium]
MKRMITGTAMATTSAIAVMLLTVAAHGQSGRRPIDRERIQRLIDSIRGTTIIVDWHGTWDYETIQEALDASDDGDTIVVLPSEGSPAGAYVENVAFPAKAITLRSINPDDPGIVASTIIDGNAVDSVVAFEGGATADTVLDGFTIQNGLATNGGGLICFASSPTISRCTIVDNTADYYGGGIYCSGSDPTIDRCTISGNSAEYAGGMRNAYSSNPILTNCVFSGNEASSFG